MSLDELLSRLGSTGLVVVVGAAAITAMLGYTKIAITVAPTRPPEQTVAVAAGSHQVATVTDGDSIRLVDVDRPIRLIGIDAPESTAVRFGQSECFGSQSADYLASLIDGATVEIELGQDPTDRYDRVLAYVWIEGDHTLINEAMVRAGMAYAVEYRPNTRHSDRLFAAEAAAQSERLGIWGDCPIEEHR